MGQKKWLETEQSVSDILKLKPGLDFRRGRERNADSENHESGGI